MGEKPQTLARLAAGESAVVSEINLPEGDQHRLLEMGLITGTPVELIRFAPLGDPIEVRVRGYHLTLRKHEADQILVTKATD